MLSIKKVLAKILDQAEFKTLLWTNPSPTSSYAGGTPVSALDADEYDAVEIQFILWTGYQYICATDRAYKGEAMITTSVASSNAYIAGSRPDPLARAWDFTSGNGVRIYGGVEANFAVNGTYAQADHVLIPYKIYGIKHIGSRQ